MSKKIYTKQKLEEAVSQSKCFTDVCRFVGSGTSGNSYQRIRRLITDFNIDTSHFLNPKIAGLEKAGIRKEKKHWSEILVADHQDRLRSKQIRRALKESGVEYICDECGLGSDWNGKELTLDVDHIDGNKLNSIKENLRFLCPNCHRQITEIVNSKRCENCNKKISPKSKWCVRCASLFSDRQRKVKNRPDLKTLLSDVENIGYVGTGKKYNVSDNTIRKWIKFETNLNGEKNER